MPTDLVRLHWRDTDELEIAEGRAHDGHALLPRYRAEALAEAIRTMYPDRFILALEPWNPETSEVDEKTEIETARPTVIRATFLEDAAEAMAVAVAPGPMGKLLAALAFVRAHRHLFIALAVVVVLAVEAILAIYLPHAEARAYAVSALAITALLVGFLSPQPKLPEL